MDYFIPNGNEKELLKSALNLGITDIIFLYTFDKYKTAPIINISELDIETDEDIIINKGIILEKPTLKDIRKSKSLSKIIVIKADDNVRTYMEQFGGICIYDFEHQLKSDFMHFRNSGLNQVLAKIAVSKKTKILFNFSDFLSKSDRIKSVLLGRLKQNIKLYEKYGVNFQIASFANSNDKIRNDFSAFIRLLKSNKIELINEDTK